MMDNLTPRLPSPSSPEEFQARVDVCAGYLAQGFTQAQIVNYVRDSGKINWNVTDRQVRTYISRASEQLAAQADELDRKYWFSISLARYNAQYRKSDSLNNTAQAIQAVDRMVKLLRLDDPTANIDWRSLATAQGIDPAELFGRLVQIASEPNTLTEMLQGETE